MSCQTARARVCVAALVYAVPFLVTVDAGAQTTALFFDSQPGDYVGAGQTVTFTPPVALFTPSRNGNGGIGVTVRSEDWSFWWYLNFSRVDYEPLTVGTYENARRYPFSRFNALDVSGDGRGCNQLTGRFEVKEVEYAPDGSVARFAADFEQHCEDAEAALFGAIRYNSSISDLTPFGGAYPVYRVSLSPPSHGTISGDDISCTQGSGPCVRTMSKPMYVALRATPDPGYELLAWDGDCQGGEISVLRVNGPKSCTALFAPVTTATPRLALVFDSQTATTTTQREYVGQGWQRRYSAATSRVTATTMNEGNYVRFWFWTSDNTWWTAEFRAPGTALLVPGDYPDAHRAAFSNGAAGLDFSGDGRGCNELTGRFVVYDSTYAPDGSIATFAADFEQHCENGPLALFGSIRYNSTSPGIEPFGGSYPRFRTTIVPAQHGRVVGGPILCGGYYGPWACNAAFPSAGSLTLTAEPETGYVFDHWSGDCSGSNPVITVAVDSPADVCVASFVAFRLVSFRADATFPTRFGHPITWTAEATRSGIEYRFWRLDSATGWHIVQDWSTTPTYTWTPSYSDIGNHAIQVWARVVGSSAQYDDWRGQTFDIEVGALPTVSSITSDPAPPYYANAGAVAWTALASGGVGTPHYEFWRRDPDGWHLAQPYGASNTYVWTPGIADVGDHAVQVWVRNSDSGAPYEAWRALTFSVVPPAPLTVTALTPDVTPAIGVATTWTTTTTGGTGPLQFQFWRLDGEGWHIVQAYGTNRRYTWTPGLADVGHHALQVWVRNADSAADYDAWRGVTFMLAAPPQLTVALAALGPLPAAGQGSVAWRATATGGLSAREYKFWRLDSDGWHMVQDYGTGDTYAWSPGLNDGGNHAVQVWARNAGSTAAYEAWATTGVFTIAPPPAIHLAFTAVPPLPAVAGATLTWAVQADVTGVEYEVWRYDDGAGWHVVQPYSAAASYTWVTSISDAGSHALQFWVRRVGSTAAYEGWIASGFFLITP